MVYELSFQSFSATYFTLHGQDENEVVYELQLFFDESERVYTEKIHGQV